MFIKTENSCVLTSNCRGVLHRLAGRDGSGEYGGTAPFCRSSSAPKYSEQEERRGCSKLTEGSDGSGGVMGDKGRSKSSEGVATASGAYFDFLFLKGAINSEGRNVEAEELRYKILKKILCTKPRRDNFIYLFIFLPDLEAVLLLLLWCEELDSVPSSMEREDMLSSCACFIHLYKNLSKTYTIVSSSKQPDAIQLSTKKLHRRV